jgi:hypothetical protein
MDDQQLSPHVPLVSVPSVDDSGKVQFEIKAMKVGSGSQVRGFVGIQFSKETDFLVFTPEQARKLSFALRRYAGRADILGHG